MRARLPSAACLALAIALAATAAPATAKDFGPGDLRICSAKRCVSIVDQSLLNALSRFYYGGPAPAEVRAPRLGAPYFQLRFSNGYVTGIAATVRLDRFRSYGVNTGQFGPDSWYRVPATAAAGLRRLADRLAPLRVTGSTIGRTRYT